MNFTSLPIQLQDEESTAMLSSNSRESESDFGEKDDMGDFMGRNGARAKFGMNWGGNAARTINRRGLLCVLIGLIGVSFVFTYLVDPARLQLSGGNFPLSEKNGTRNSVPSLSNETKVEEWLPFDKMLAMNFEEPQQTLASQLKPGVRYLTGMGFGGHSNQFIAVLKLIYLSKITNRVAVIPTLVPLHFDGPPQDFSDFYHLGKLYGLSGVPTIEFSSFKPFDVTRSSPQNEKISCWSVQEATQGGANLGAASMDFHGIWIDFWALPRGLPRGLGGHDLAYDGIRIFDFDAELRRKWIETSREEFQPQTTLSEHAEHIEPAENLKPGFDPLHTEPPSDQLLCLDNGLFFGPIMFPEAYNQPVPLEPYAPGEGLSWIDVGQYIYFNDRVESVADQYLMEIFNVDLVEEIPVFISIHLRRGDFQEFTGLTPLEKYQMALERVVKSLQIRIENDNWRGPGKDAFARYYDKKGGLLNAADYKIVITTDEPSGSEFIRDVKALGWKVLDHQVMETDSSYGPWYSTILDAAILARGKGFVGTPFSTFSHLSGLRVKYWNGGIIDLAL